MTTRTPWDTQEALLLLDTYDLIRNKPEDRASLIKALSQNLKNRATDRNITIDTTFRNEESIRRHLQLVKTLLEGRFTDSKKTGSQAIEEVTSLYINHRRTYLKQLRELEIYRIHYVSASEPFDLPEAVLVLDAYLHLSVPGESKAHTARLLSLKLRTFAEKNGDIYTDSYRTESGLIRAFETIGCLYDGLLMTDGNVPQAFSDAVNLYRRSSQLYKSILKQTESIIGKVALQEDIDKEKAKKQRAHDASPVNITKYVTTKKDRSLKEKYGRLFSAVYDELERRLYLNAGPTIATEIYQVLHRKYLRKDVIAVLEGASWAKETTSGHYVLGVGDKILKSLASNEKVYFSWVKKRISKKQLAMLKGYCPQINYEFVQHHILNSPLMLVSDIETVKKLEQRKLSFLPNSNLREATILMVRTYAEFLESGEPVSFKNEQAQAADNSDPQNDGEVQSEESIKKISEQTENSNTNTHEQKKDAAAPLRIGWDKYEVALLIEACEKVLNGEVRKSEIAPVLSSSLRRRAQNRGLEFDDIFRNENGIILQMTKMTYLLTNGAQGLAGASHLYEDMVKLKQKDSAAFEAILQEAKSQLEKLEGDKSQMNQMDGFRKWLNSKVTEGISPTSVVATLEEVSGYCIRHKISTIKLWNFSNPEKVGAILKRLSKFYMFRITHINKLKEINAAFQLYCEYLTLIAAQGSSVPEPTDKEKVQPEEQKSAEASPQKQDKKSLSPAQLYQKLYQISMIFNDPAGIPLSQIERMLGYRATADQVRAVLDSASWATALSENIYSFEKKKKRNDILQTQVACPADFDKEKYIQTLLRRYRNGMTFDSIDFDNFREMYDMLYDEQIPFDDAALEKRLRFCGVVYQDRLFPAEGIIDNETKEKLYAYIDSSFAAGKNVLYYKAIYEELSDIFATCYTLTDENMLRAYLQFTTESGKYIFFDDYISKERSVSVNHNADVENYLLSAGKPMSVDEISAALSNIPRKQVEHVINADSYILRNAKSEYFHLDIFEAAPEELEQIAGIIQEIIQANEYAIWTDVWNDIQECMPAFIENNSYLSGLGIRNALAKRLSTKFRFSSAVISMPKDSYSMRDIYQLFAKHHPVFTIDEISKLSKELDTNIYFDAIYSFSVRVDHDTFVSKNQIQIDVDDADRAIGSFMAKDYIRLREIDSFLAFPNAGFEWNQYLLEGYVYSFSRKFELVNNGFSVSNVAGAIVRKNGKIKDFVDVVANVLAEADIKLTKTEALKYLADVNMISRKSYRDIDLALEKATQIRDRKG